MPCHGVGTGGQLLASSHPCSNLHSAADKENVHTTEKSSLCAPSAEHTIVIVAGTRYITFRAASRAQNGDDKGLLGDHQSCVKYRDGTVGLRVQANGDLVSSA